MCPSFRASRALGMYTNPWARLKSPNVSCCFRPWNFSNVASLVYYVFVGKWWLGDIVQRYPGSRFTSAPHRHHQHQHLGCGPPELIWPSAAANAAVHMGQCCMCDCVFLSVAPVLCEHPHSIMYCGRMLLATPDASSIRIFMCIIEILNVYHWNPKRDSFIECVTL